MTDKHDQARPNAQAEARAIVSAYFKGSSAYDDSALVKDIAAALAAKDAELADLREQSTRMEATLVRTTARSEAPAVKALEWHDDPRGGLQAIGAGMARYRVKNDLWYLENDLMGEGGVAAAQADYERRIRSAIAAPAAPEPAPDVVEALRQAADRFDEIRLILIKHLDEPQRSAFWKAVNGREFCRRAALEGKP